MESIHSGSRRLRRITLAQMAEVQLLGHEESRTRWSRVQGLEWAGRQCMRVLERKKREYEREKLQRTFTGQRAGELITEFRYLTSQPIDGCILRRTLATARAKAQVMNFKL